MTAYLVRRLLIVLVTLLVASLLVFLVLQIVPGDPALLMLGINASEDAIANLRDQLGLNLPVWQRYINWVCGMLQGDFGRSYTYAVPVTELVGERLMVSLPLALLALFLSTAIAIPVAFSPRRDVAHWPIPPP